MVHRVTYTADEAVIFKKNVGRYPFYNFSIMKLLIQFSI